MNPNPLSRTSRLIVPLAIRVSLSTHVCPGPEYQFPFQKTYGGNLPNTAGLLTSAITSCEKAIRVRTENWSEMRGRRPLRPRITLLDVDGNHRARAGQRVVQIVA